MSEKIVLGARELSLLDAAYVSSQPSFARQATLRFEPNKQQKELWGRSKPRDMGHTDARNTKVDAARRELSGICLFDLAAIVGESMTPVTTAFRTPLPPQLGPSFFRRNVVMTVVHELYHVLQGWRLSTDFRLAVMKENIETANLPPDADPPFGMIEAEARGFAAQWAETRGDAIAEGKFNFVLPMTFVREKFGPSPFH